MRIRRPGKLIVAQGAAAFGALIALTMWPPTFGKMLLVPVAGANANEVAKIALAGRASLIGTGPFPGSLVIIGDRTAVSTHNPSWAVIIMAAPPAGCRTIDATGILT